MKDVNKKTKVSSSASSYSKYREYVKKLVDLPPNIANPDFFDGFVDELLSKHRLSKVKPVEPHPLIYAVDQNRHAPIVIQIKNNPESLDVELALVGKGVTFDTGGYNIKTRNMEEMKSDKAGACAVLGAIKYVLDNDIKINLVAVLPFVENKITPTSTLPSSIIKSLSGIYVEISDTDAEGRLVLADSLTTAMSFNPRQIVSIATLTGSCAAMLGSEFIGVFNYNSNMQPDAGKDKLIEVSTRAGDTEISKQKKGSPLKNYVGKELGGSYAAAFLRKFVSDDTQYLHFDIAGPAFVDGKATGSGIDILIQLINTHSEQY